MSADIDAIVDRWVEAPDISARSVLVTIFGDTLLPVTKSFWLAQLFQLTSALGFNQRLIRTSMYRLAAEDWLTNERVGRQSQYTLTPLAVSESEQASRRIYHREAPDWSGSWTLVMLGGPGHGHDDRELIRTHLQWHGFIPLGGDLLGSPSTEPAAVGQLLTLVDSKARPAVATAAFVDLEALVEDGFFAAAFNTVEVEDGYRSFLDLYNRISSTVDGLTPLQAFAVRTMLIHDLRRIRLRSPDVPAELLPEDWIGYRAHLLAGELYHSVVETSAEVLSEILDLRYPKKLADRF